MEWRFIMAMRLQEVHPALVHLPLTLLPLSIGADVVGRLTGDERLMWLGKRGIAAAAVAGVAAGVTGLIAQEEVNVSGPALDTLITHRTLNLAVVAATSAMAIERSRAERPGWAYLLGGLAALGTVAYSAYLGGKLVYEHGVGVEAAGGVGEGGSPELTLGNAGRVARTIGQDLRAGVRHLASETAEGKLVPSMVE
jgi:uncharacterized membrane protein